MKKPFLSRPRATSIASGVFFLALAVIAYIDFWWPGIMIPIGLGLIVRQVLIRKFYDALISLIVFGGIFFTVFYNLPWLPVLFIIAGIYLIFRAVIDTTVDDEEEEEEEIQKELEDDAAEDDQSHPHG